MTDAMPFSGAWSPLFRGQTCAFIERGGLKYGTLCKPDFERQAGEVGRKTTFNLVARGNNRTLCQACDLSWIWLQAQRKGVHKAENPLRGILEVRVTKRLLARMVKELG